jgi:O-antigen/teichoic acid export membrane protein
MTKIDKRQIIKNVGSSWFALGVNVVVGLALSPFIVHRLGDTAFGLWVIILSITGYYGLFDLGIGSSVIRFVSKYTATGEHEELAKIINTSLFTYSCIGLLCMLVTAVIASQVNRRFSVPPELHSTAPWLLLIVGTAVALGFPFGVFGGFLEGLQRFYILNWTNIGAVLLRAVLIVYSLKHGQGIVAVALVTVGLPLLASIARGFIALHYCPVPFGFKYVDRATFRRIANYSGITFVIMIASQLKFKTDELVIGSMMSFAWVTYFNVGARIVDYAGMVVRNLSQIFVPMTSQSEARGEQDRLRKIFLLGNRVCAFTIFPICAVLVLLGKSVIEVWMGKKYVAESYPVLVIMILCCTLWWAQGASGRILLGMSKHKTWAIVTVSEGVANLILSIILVRYWGIVGDALGTAIPLTCSMVFFMPHHLCKKLDVHLRTFLYESYTLPFLLCMPLVAVLWLMRRWFVPHNYRQLGLQFLIAGSVYGLGILWAVLSKRALRVGEFALIGKSAPPVGDPIIAPEEVYQRDV